MLKINNICIGGTSNVLSVVIPTYNEGKNIPFIVKKLSDVLKNLNYEIIFVDDSRDNTVEYLKRASEENSKVKYFHRENARGLATAVMLGFEKSEGKIIAVMDADLQHPPELLVSMFQAIKQGGDIVIPSRFIPDGDDGGLNLFRKFVSYTARKIGGIFIKKLRNFSDNTSGYFMFKKDIIKDCDLDPVGWKILIEILVKARYNTVIEIPYKFQERNAGESKMSIKEQFNYIKHIMRLLKSSPSDLRFILFCIVGFSGVLVNLMVYTLLVSFGVKITSAAFLSGFLAMISNFIFNDCVTWKEVKDNNIILRGIKNFIVSIVGIGINVEVLYLLITYININYIVANCLSISVATIWNYFVNKLWTWKKSEKEDKIKVIKWTNDDVYKVDNAMSLF